MRLYLDQQFPASFVNILRSVHALDHSQEYEVVSGVWTATNNATDTVVFLVDTSKHGLDPHAIRYYRDGFRVFTFRKPYDKPYSLFKQTLIFLSQWGKILNTIKSDNSPFIYTISEAKKPLVRYNVEGGQS